MNSQFDTERFFGLIMLCLLTGRFLLFDKAVQFDNPLLFDNKTLFIMTVFGFKNYFPRTKLDTVVFHSKLKNIQF